MKNSLLGASSAHALAVTMHARDPLTGGVLPRNLHRFKTGDGTPAMSPMAQAQAIQQADFQATQLIRAQGQPMFQQMLQQAVGGNNAALGQTVNFNLINVGLNRRVVLEITGTIAPANGEQLTATPWGIMNLLSNVTLTDLSNYQRVNTNLRHLYALATARNRAVYGAAYLTDAPVAMGSNYGVNTAPKMVAAATDFRIFVEIPLAYRDDDYRGAIWANVTGGQWRLSVTFASAQQFCVGSAVADTTNACYKSSTANDVGVLSNVNMIVHQDYIDQIPINPKTGRPILPTMSLAYNYLVLNTPQNAPTPNTDFPIQYTNFRTFLSTMLEYNDGGAMVAGTNINYLGIQVANQVYLTKADPFAITLMSRKLIGDDFPPGWYYIDHREKPIITNQYGNTQLVMNVKTAGAGSYSNAYWEMLSVQNQALNAGSLAGS